MSLPIPGYFWLKVLHIAAMTIWLAGLFFLPRLFIAQARGRRSEGVDELAALGGTLYFRIMTPAALLTISLGLALTAFGFSGVWFPVKMALASVLVVLHLYYGRLLQGLRQGRVRHGAGFAHVLSWTPLGIVLAIAALTAAKP